MAKLLAKYIFGDICVQYRFDEDTGVVGLELLPLGWNERRQPKRQKG